MIKSSYLIIKRKAKKIYFLYYSLFFSFYSSKVKISMTMNCVLTIMIMIVMVIMGNTNEHYNAKEFRQLCKILRVAEGEPEKIPNELGKFMYTRSILEKLLRATKTSTATYQKVVKLSANDEEDGDFISYTVKRKTANAKIQHAMEKAKDIYTRMEEEFIQANKEQTQARNNLVHAIYGVQMGELPKEEEISSVLQNVSRLSISNGNGGVKNVKYHGNSTKPACGGVGENGAGFTLINDFYCLCVGKDNEKKVCHEKIKGPGVWKLESDCKKCEDCCKDGTCCCCCEGDCGNECKCGGECKCGSKCSCIGGKCTKCVLTGTWLSMKNDSDEELELQHGWPHIRKVCNETSTEQVNTTAESIQEVLDEFNKLLGSNSNTDIDTSSDKAEMDARRLFVLGFSKKIDGQGCNGNGQGVCVNYWSVSNLGIGIVWQNYMLEAQKHLKAMDKHIQKVQQLSSMIQKLKESAEESYRNSAHESMLWPLEDGFRKKKIYNFFIFFALFV
ncbi:Variant surface glycoprotein [Trypanosoma congolense IL3000]|uniref:Variant surface glycoprotein n=1 Tax=Trypanosoma congolense (strain IL3000) TaxID=1068625 RepID=F9W4A1_TRYCI|nr:Variant surface glycoprotein [Trypanosoma congolense IL3000]